MLKQGLRNAALVIVAVMLALSVMLGILLAVTVTAGNVTAARFNFFSVEELANELTQDAFGRYALSAEGESQLQEFRLWAMLLDASGRVVWAENKPNDVPEQYSLADVASFSRWYLRDYPVSVWHYGDGLLVAGGAKDSVWKYNIIFARVELDRLLFLLPLGFLATLALILILGRRSMKKEQSYRDTARSRWIDGISHDIRTPLSIIMGYAGDWQEDASLPAERRTQAESMVGACTNVQKLGADLNLTMRLDYEMQPLRKAACAPAALMRAVAADALNSGLAAELEMNMDAAAKNLQIRADAALLRRALTNLLQNAVRYGDGTAVLRVQAERHKCLFVVENPCPGGVDSLLTELNQKRAQPQIACDGAAAHGTGLRLVQQIARTHGGSLRFCKAGEGEKLRAELRIPLA